MSLTTLSTPVNSDLKLYSGTLAFDRADVWEWSLNLLKLRPCTFATLSYRGTHGLTMALPDDLFVGIGDINLTFLPKALSLVLTPSSGHPAAHSREAAPSVPQLPTSPS